MPDSTPCPTESHGDFQPVSGNSEPQIKARCWAGDTKSGPVNVPVLSGWGELSFMCGLGRGRGLTCKSFRFHRQCHLIHPAGSIFILCAAEFVLFTTATERQPGCGWCLQLHLSCQVQDQDETRIKWICRRCAATEATAATVKTVNRLLKV